MDAMASKSAFAWEVMMVSKVFREPGFFFIWHVPKIGLPVLSGRPRLWFADSITDFEGAADGLLCPYVKWEEFSSVTAALYFNSTDPF